MADNAVPGAVGPQHRLNVGGVRGNLVAVVRVIECSDQFGCALSLIVHDQNGPDLGHVSSVAANEGGTSEFFLVPIIVKLRKVILHLTL